MAGVNESCLGSFDGSHRYDLFGVDARFSGCWGLISKDRIGCRRWLVHTLWLLLHGGALVMWPGRLFPNKSKRRSDLCALTYFC